MNESQFNGVMVKSIKAQRIFAYKTADRFQVGVPDIYVTGGTWVEGKIVKRKVEQRIRSITPLDLLSPAQRSFGEVLMNHGDMVIVAVYFELGHMGSMTRRIVLRPFDRACDPLSHDDIIIDHMNPKKLDLFDLHRIFWQGEKGNVNPSWWATGI